MLTGSARVAREAQERAEVLERKQEIDRKQQELEQKRILFHAQMAALKSQFEAEENDLRRLIDQSLIREDILARDKQNMARIRGVDDDIS
ncbi:MAG: hypothetical protein HQK55_00685 [Deltaproteobacteria bacterium]|nr:hypothetical protein [Deltaproteobacteria bacterium]